MFLLNFYEKYYISSCTRTSQFPCYFTMLLFGTFFKISPLPHSYPINIYLSINIYLFVNREKLNKNVSYFIFPFKFLKSLILYIFGRVVKNKKKRTVSNINIFARM